jgi:ABC-type branched-subunit amino acid transport system substrate-binding protein
MSKTTGAPLKIMVIAPENTQSQNFPENYASAEAAALAVNKRGGIGGHPLQVIYCNEMDDPNQDITCARQAASDHVIATVGDNMLGGGSYTGIMEAEKIPNIGTEAETPAEFTSPSMFLLDGGTLSNFAAAVVAVKQAGYTKIASAPIAITAGETATAFIKSGVVKAGLKYVGTVQMPETTTDYSPIVANLAATGAQAVFVDAAAGQIEEVAKAAPSNGYTGALVYTAQSIGANQLSSHPLGASTAKALVASAFPPPTENTPAIKRYNAELNAAARAGVTNANIRDANGMQAWLAVQVVERVGDSIKGAINNVTLGAALRAAHDINLGGVIPPWTPDKPGPSAALSRVSNPTAYMMKIVGTRYQLIESKPLNGFSILHLG